MVLIFCVKPWSVKDFVFEYFSLDITSNRFSRKCRRYSKILFSKKIGTNEIKENKIKSAKPNPFPTALSIENLEVFKIAKNMFTNGCKTEQIDDMEIKMNEIHPTQEKTLLVLIVGSFFLFFNAPYIAKQMNKKTKIIDQLLMKSAKLISFAME